ncbi:ABC transporter, ATP-binding protein YbhF domain protein [Enterobacter hormaechei subsp. xiangfangensis]|nr:ABC transporter, ATP-binding protein YbhF domain protein [Enterobacter hormaechei subsp. xiangfangensis]
MNEGAAYRAQTMAELLPANAFIDLLGGAGTSESPLGAILHTVEGTPGETVIEPPKVRRNFGEARRDIWPARAAAQERKHPGASTWAIWRRSFRSTAT